MAKKTSKKKKSTSKAESDIVAQINAAFGAGSLVAMSTSIARDHEVIPTGSRRLDVALGIGGWPCGRIVEIYGGEAASKTSLCLHAVANAQKMGKKVAYIDAEHALDLEWAERIGVDVDDLLVSQPDYGEQGLEIADRLINSGYVGVIAIDSVSALTPKAELEGEVGASHVALQARMMGQSLRKMVASASKNNVLVLFVNQVRASIGFGSGKVTGGGNALKFYASIRVDVVRTGQVKKGSGDTAETTGAPIKATVRKNKLAPPFRVCKYVITFDAGGIDMASELVEDGVGCKALVHDGNTFTYTDDEGNDTKLGVGRHNAVEALRAHPDIMQVVYDRVVAADKVKRLGKDPVSEPKEPQGSTTADAVAELME